MTPVGRRRDNDELYLGRYADHRDHIRCGDRKYAGSDGCCAAVLQGGSDTRHLHARYRGILDRADGSGTGGGRHHGPHKADRAVHALSVSEDPEGTPGVGLPVRQFCRKYPGTWLGGDAGGALSYNSDRLKKSLKN